MHFALQLAWLTLDARTPDGRPATSAIALESGSGRRPGARGRLLPWAVLV